MPENTPTAIAVPAPNFVRAAARFAHRGLQRRGLRLLAYLAGGFAGGARTFTDLLGAMRGFVPFAVCFAVFAQSGGYITISFGAMVWMTCHGTLNFVLLFVMLSTLSPEFVFVGLFNQVTGHNEIRDASGE